jgi:nitrogen regulatory protein PII
MLMKGLCLLFTIIKRSDIKEYHDFFEQNSVSVIYDTLGNGTAHEKTLSLLGIEKNEKAVLVSFVTYPTLKKILRGLALEMKIDLPDRGIAIAVPLSSVGGAKTLEYFSAGQDTDDLNDGANAPQNEEVEMQTVQELIVAIYEKGYTDFVMDAAREAGAGGGTTIRAKGTSAGAQKFFGLSLADEKEMLFIVTSTAKKKDIMKAIMQNAGMESKAHSLVFSLPVTDSAGFRFADEVVKE